MTSKKLGEPNKLYNFQDTVILCEIFENRSSQQQKLFIFNPRKCNCASSFSGCVHRDKSKRLIALPTESEYISVFEKTLIGGFSCVNTWLALDTQILSSDIDNNKLILDLKKQNNVNQKKKIATKVLKMNENNQYGQAITIPLPYGCVKKMKSPTMP